MENQTCKGLMVQYSTPPPTDEHGQPTSAKQFMRNKHKKRMQKLRPRTQSNNNTQTTPWTLSAFGAKLPNPTQNRRKRGRVLAPKREEGSSFSLPRNFINIITEFKDVAAAQLKSGHDQILFCDGDIIDLMT